jgi:hypothetical protein
MYIHIISWTVTNCFWNMGPDIDVQWGICIWFWIYILQRGVSAADVHSNCITDGNCACNTGLILMLPVLNRV